MMRRAGIFLIGFCLAYLPLSGQVEASARLDSSRILIGDQVHLELLIAHPQGIRVNEVDWPVIQESGKIEVLNPGTLDSVPAQGGQVLLRQDILLTSFDSGYHRIPPIPVRYLQEGGEGVTETGDLALLVSTFPVAADTASLAPIKTIIEEPLALQDLLPWIAGALALVLLGGGLLLWLRRKEIGKAFSRPEVVRPPHEVALEDLDKLRAAGLWQSGQLKAYYSELTRIMRTFLEKRFQIPALESTTGETMAMLGSLPLEKAWKQDLETMLRTADSVKFAKATPPAEKHAALLDSAVAMIRQVPPEEEKEEEKTETAEGNFAKN